MTIDFVGRIDGVEFEGGKGEDVQLVIGKSSFIPGFVEGIEGAKAGEERVVKVKFPDDYPGKAAGRQGCRIQGQGQGGGQADQAGAQRRVRQDAGRGVAGPSCASWCGGRIAGEYAGVARMKLKRQVSRRARQGARLRACPKSLVEGEFQGIWETVAAET